MRFIFFVFSTFTCIKLKSIKFTMMVAKIGELVNIITFQKNHMRISLKLIIWLLNEIKKVEILYLHFQGSMHHKNSILKYLDSVGWI